VPSESQNSRLEPEILHGTTAYSEKKLHFTVFPASYGGHWNVGNEFVRCAGDSAAKYRRNVISCGF
jgi:hypothetical protein